MTVETESAGEPILKSGPYNGNGVTDTFAYDFPIQANTEVEVLRKNADETIDVLTLTTDYTVSGVGVDAGGQVTILDPATDAPTGSQIIIRYDGDFLQDVDWSTQSAIQLSQLEAALDKQMMHLRQMQERLERTIQAAAFSGAADFEFPSADALKYIRWNAGGTALENANLAAAAALTLPGVVGDNEIPAWDGVGGLTLQRSGVYASDGDLTVAGAVVVTPHAGDNLPFVDISTLGGSAGKNHLFVRDDNTTRDDNFTVQIQRLVDNDGGFANPAALKVKYTVQVGGDPNSRPWAVNAEFVSEATANPSTGEAGVALSGVSSKTGGNNGILFAGHLQARDETAAATLGGLIGCEVNITGTGADTNTNRYGVDIIPKTQSGADFVGTAGIRVRSDTGTNGKWTNAILVEQGTVNNDVGLRLAGTFGTYAIHMDTANWFGMSTDGSRRMRYNNGADAIEFRETNNERFAFRMNGTPIMSILGTQVVGARKTGWAAATGTATRTTFVTSTVTTAQLAERVKALVDDLISHGLIGA